MRLFIFVEI